MRPRDESGRSPDGERAAEVIAAEVIAAEVRGVPPGEVPGRLCRVAVRLLPVTGASASLRGEGVPVRLCASGDRASYLAEIQSTLGDGPCVSAAESGAPVLARDLTAGADVGRWPVFAQQATAVGVRAVYALPLGNDAVCLGTLDLYRDTPGGLTGPQLSLARLVAGVMTVALMALPRGEGAAWLDELAGDHDEVYQAVGMIMAQLGIGADEALARLRADAFARGRTAHEVACDVLTHRRRFDRDG
ncbi:MULTISPECIES: GAF and ANTAR domain-containing protein [unclassified Streptomyces]|uniref:GAF and ANTAR domain-containing protein n=1 Tax=unclassified Streptomyces TaxID=2593676 RepID=UPI0024435BCA|nr:GAF and ANTAR domain-containing protein [Streptomyces sp. DH41]MDG9726465.1 GAF and ANTAR domain-containing protein [Streptomyces sp. DH41]